MGITNYRIDKQSHIMANGLSVAQYVPHAASAAYQWWDDDGAISGCVAAYQAKGAASLAASYTDLSGNGNDAAPGTAPGWSSGNGWEFTAASSHYLTTGLNPAYTWSMHIRFSNFSGASFICGRRTIAVNNEFSILPAGGSGERDVRISQQRRSVASGGLTSGVYGFSGYSAGDTNGAVYLNGSSDGDFDTAITALSQTIPVYIGCINQWGTATSFSTCYVQAFALYNTALSSADAITIQTAMAAL